jgi:hypothetical protein
MTQAARPENLFHWGWTSDIIIKLFGEAYAIAQAELGIPPSPDRRKVRVSVPGDGLGVAIYADQVVVNRDTQIAIEELIRAALESRRDPLSVPKSVPEQSAKALHGFYGAALRAAAGYPNRVTMETIDPLDAVIMDGSLAALQDQTFRRFLDRLERWAKLPFPPILKRDLPLIGDSKRAIKVLTFIEDLRKARGAEHEARPLGEEAYAEELRSLARLVIGGKGIVRRLSDLVMDTYAPGFTTKLNTYGPTQQASVRNHIARVGLPVFTPSSKPFGMSDGSPESAGHNVAAAVKDAVHELCRIEMGGRHWFDVEGFYL